MKSRLVLLLLISPMVGIAQPQPQPVASTNFDNLQIKPITQRPCLMFEASEIPEMKRHLEALKVFPMHDLKCHPALFALLYGDEQMKKNATEDFMVWARKRLNHSDFSQIPTRRFNDSMLDYDLIASFGYLTDAEKKEFKEMAIRVAKHLVGDDPATFPSPKTPRHNGLEFPTGFSTCNRWPDMFLGATLFGLNFPDEPLSKAWVKYACQQLEYILAHGNLDGEWNECPRYQNFTMQLFCVFFQSLKNRTGVNFFQDPNTKAMIDWHVRFSSPLVRFPETTKQNPLGEPTLPVWGDSNYENSFHTCAMYAAQYKDTDPALAKRLMWMWRRSGAKYNNFMGLVFASLADPTLPDSPQTLGSELTRKIGMVLLRSGFNTPDETVVYMRGGVQGPGHMRSDLGSIDLFSQGIPLALGSESGPYNAQIDWNRSQISNNDIVFGKKDRDRRECQGMINAFFTSPQVDYAVADCSRPESKMVKAAESFHWRRHLLLVKNPDYLAVWDEISSSLPSEYFLHTTADHFAWQPNLVTSHTAYNADLDIHVLLPKSGVTPNEKQGPFGSWDWKKTPTPKDKEDPYPFYMLKYFSIPAQPNEDFLTILHPRKPDGAQLTTTFLSASKGQVRLKVTHGTSTDLITIGKDGASFQRDALPAITIPMQIQKPSAISPPAI